MLGGNGGYGVRFYLVGVIEDSILHHMRRKGTKYNAITTDELKGINSDIMQVSVYAEQHKIPNMNYVYIKYDRFLAGKGSNPGYTIRCWNGSNIVIPN